MAKQSIDLNLDLVQQLFSDPQRLRSVLEVICQAAMAEEVSAHLGAESHERSGDRCGYRNGHKPRTADFLTGMGHSRAGIRYPVTGIPSSLTRMPDPLVRIPHFLTGIGHPLAGIDDFLIGIGRNQLFIQKKLQLSAEKRALPANKLQLLRRKRALIAKKL